MVCELLTSHVCKKLSEISVGARTGARIACPKNSLPLLLYELVFASSGSRKHKLESIHTEAHI